MRTWRWAFDAALGFVVTVLVLAFVGILSYREIHSLIAAQRWVNHSHEILRDIEAIRARVSDSERIQSLFLATGNPKDLQTESRNLHEIQMRIEHLRTLTLDNSAQNNRVVELERSSDQRANWWQATVRSIQDHRQQRAKTSELLSTEGLEAGAIRDSLGQMAAEEGRFLQDRVRESEARSRRATHVAIVLAVFALVTVGLAYRAILILQLKLQHALAKEKELARMDTLTGVANRRAFYEALESEKERACRHKLPLTVAYVDLDDFKKINDSLGHATGDLVLTTVAGILRHNLRSTDLVARIGGDEFSLLLPETAEDAARIVLKKLQMQLQQKMNTEEWSIGFSIGAASFHNPGLSAEEILRAADQLMYEVKALGKNKISVAVLG